MEVSKAPGLQVLLEMHLLDVSEAELALHLPAGTGGTSSQRVLSGGQAAAFLGAARADATGEVLALPSIVTTDGEDALVEAREDDPAKRWSRAGVSVPPHVLVPGQAAALLARIGAESSVQLVAAAKVLALVG